MGQRVAAANKLALTKAKEKNYLESAISEIAQIKIDKKLSRLLCAAIYWCEGTKSPKAGVCFTNSDPKLVRKFLFLLRNSFELDEKKFRPCIHLHSYHNPQKQLAFWSKMTNINKRQFIKPYLKLNTGKRIRDNYQGCISVRYHSNDLARRLIAIAKGFLD
ncbi:MAG: hypothetical protein Q8R55_04075 [Candidatus Taylorbacteria bacterium]|nr:hypothetical protein [Candidatus Taylorbacteria bacterium]